MSEYKQFKADPLAEIRANQAVLAGRITALEGQRPHHPTPHPDPRCEAISPDEAEVRCYLWEGHDGGHVSWPVAIKWGPYCGAAFNEHCCTLDKGHDGWHQEWVEALIDTATWQPDPEPVPTPDPEPEAAKTKTYRCEWCDAIHYDAHAGHVCPCRVVPDPEPVPRWRALVDTGESAIWADAGPEIRLSRVLQDLSTLAKPATSHQVSVYALARIVAVCEAQVGGGWQADPSGWLATPSIHALLHKLTMDPREVAFPETNWIGLGNAASARLRDLTDGAQ